MLNQKETTSVEENTTEVVSNVSETKTNLTIDYKKAKEKLNSFGYSTFLQLVDFVEKNTNGNLKKEANKVLKDILQTNDIEKMSDLALKLQGIVSKYKRKKEEAQRKTKEAQRKAFEKQLSQKVEEIKDIELKGHYKGGTWEDFKNIALEDLEIEDENEKKQLLKLLEEKYKPLYEKLGGNLDTEEIGTVLDSMAEQIIKAKEDKDGKITIKIENPKYKKALNFIQGYLVKGLDWGAKKSGLYEEGLLKEPINIGENSITFDSKQEAIEQIKAVKEFLQEIESVDLNEIVWSISKAGLKKGVEGIWFIDKHFYSLLKKDFELTTTNGALGVIVGGAINVAILVYLKKFLDKANSGIGEGEYKKLVNELEENIKLYKEAGFEESEIKNLINLRDDIKGYSPEREGAQVDKVARNRYVYAVLQQFRGSAPVDYGRFVSANIGNFFDGNIWGGDLKGLEKLPLIKYLFDNSVGRKITESKIANFIVRSHLLPIKLLTVGVNKGPKGKLGGWAWQTKSEVINSYIDEFEKTNKKFEKIFKIIDSINEFSSTEKQEVKNKIFKAYKGDIMPFSKYDPLKTWKINLKLMTDGERKILYSGLEEKLDESGITKKDGSKIEIKSITDFLLNLRKLNSEKGKFMKDLLKSLNPIENIDRISAEILGEELRKKLGDNYNPDLKKTVEEISKNADDFDKNIEKLIELKDKYLNFIEFYPEISDNLEKELKQILEIEANLYKTPEELENRMIEVLKNNYGLDLDKQKIKDFLDIFEKTGRGVETNNPKIQEHEAKLIEILNDLHKSGKITEQEKNSRIQKINDFYKSGKTLWMPHYLEILDRLLEGKDIDSIKIQDILNDMKINPKTFFTEKGIDLKSKKQSKKPKKKKKKKTKEKQKSSSETTKNQRRQELIKWATKKDPRYDKAVEETMEKLELKAILEQKDPSKVNFDGIDTIIEVETKDIYNKKLVEDFAEELKRELQKQGAKNINGINFEGIKDILNNDSKKANMEIVLENLRNSKLKDFWERFKESKFAEEVKRGKF